MMIFRRFRFVLMLAVCSFLTFVSPLRAGEVKYPATGPGITLTMPDSWTASKKDGSLTYVSPDGKVVIVLTQAVGDNKKMETAARDFASGAGMTNVEVKVMPDSEEDGTRVSAAVAVGKHKGEDYVTTLMKLRTAGGAKVTIIAFGEKAAVLENKEVDAIMNSIK